MCLIMVGPSAKIRDLLLRNKAELLEDVYWHNPDGVGVMYNTSGGAKAVKYLPSTQAKAVKFIQSLPNDNREIAVHWRMKTHGLIDKENCHPYAVDDGFMMHNGVLHTGNKRDVTKSDTWHFCRDFLDGNMKPALHSPGMHTLIGEYIGEGNRFVLLTADGQMSIVNKSTGVTHEGVWFSNEYAWDVGIVDPSYDPWAYGGYVGYGGAGGWPKLSKSEKKHPLARNGDEVEWTPTVEQWKGALLDADVQALVDYLDVSGVYGLLELYESMVVVKTESTHNLSSAYNRCCEALLDENWVELEAIIKDGASSIDTLAECMAYFCEWVEVELIDDGEPEPEVAGYYDYTAAVEDEDERYFDYAAAAAATFAAESAERRRRTAAHNGSDHLHETYAG
jgi:hypothetical protein